MQHIIVSLAMLFLPPCPTEDSTNCYWDASARGNGQGTSFVSVTIWDW